MCVPYIIAVYLVSTQCMSLACDFQASSDSSIVQLIGDSLTNQTHSRSDLILWIEFFARLNTNLSVFGEICEYSLGIRYIRA